MTKSDNFIIRCGGGHINRLAKDVIHTVNSLRPGKEILTISHTDYGYFSDGEPNNRIMNWQEVEGSNTIFFISPNTVELREQCLDLLGMMKHDLGAKSITLVMPFMPFRRQDHPNKRKEGHRNLRWLENLKFNGADRLIVCDPHSEQTIINCEKIGLPLYVVNPTPAYVIKLNPLIEQAQQNGRKFFIYSPDMGSIARSAELAKVLNVPIATSFKVRSSSRLTETHTASEAEADIINALAEKFGIKIIIDTKELINADVCIREDELATGGTISKTCEKLLEELKVNSVVACFTHPVCVGDWKMAIGDAEDTKFKIIFCGNTIYRKYENRTDGVLETVDLSRLIGHKLTEVMESL